MSPACKPQEELVLPFQGSMDTVKCAEIETQVAPR